MGGRQTRRAPVSPADRRLIVVLALVAVLAVGGGIAAAATVRAHAPHAPRAPHAPHTPTAPLPSGTTSPAPAPKYGVDIAAGYDRAGDPALVANFDPNGGLATPRWSICPPAHPAACRRSGGDSQFLQPGPTPVGTVFEARATYRGRTYVARTVQWLGALHAVDPPQVTGRARYGARVTAGAGTWAGGWKAIPGYRFPLTSIGSGGREPDYNVLSLEACRTATGRDCVNLSPQGTTRAFGAAPPLGAAITGDYLFAFDQRNSRTSRSPAWATRTRPRSRSCP